MEFIVEFIMEFIIEIVLEGTIEVCTTKSKKVPMVLRVFAGLILGVLYGGIFIALFYAGVVNNAPILIGISFFFLIVVMIFFVKSYRAVRRKKNSDASHKNNF